MEGVALTSLQGSPGSTRCRLVQRPPLGGRCGGAQTPGVAAPRLPSHTHHTVPEGARPGVPGGRDSSRSERALPVVGSAAPTTLGQAGPLRAGDRGPCCGSRVPGPRPAHPPSCQVFGCPSRWPGPGAREPLRRPDSPAGVAGRVRVAGSWPLTRGQGPGRPQASRRRPLRREPRPLEAEGRPHSPRRGGGQVGAAVPDQGPRGPPARGGGAVSAPREPVPSHLRLQPHRQGGPGQGSGAPRSSAPGVRRQQVAGRSEPAGSAHAPGPVRLRQQLAESRQDGGSRAGHTARSSQDPPKRACLRAAPASAHLSWF